MHEAMRTRFPKEKNKIHFVPNGIEEYATKTVRNRTSTSTDTLKLITVGSLIERKGHKQILNAVNSINTSNNRVSITLTIVGDGPLKKTLIDHCHALDIEQYVHFLGHVPHEKIQDQLHNADAFILASYSEGRPNVVIEAMGAALPIVASRISGNLELIQHGHNGLLFINDDNDDLCRQIMKLAESIGIRERLGTSARKKIFDDNISWQRTANEYFHIFKECIL